MRYCVFCLILILIIITASAEDIPPFKEFFAKFSTALKNNNSEYVLNHIKFPLPVWSRFFGITYPEFVKGQIVKNPCNPGLVNSFGSEKPSIVAYTGEDLMKMKTFLDEGVVEINEYQWKYMLVLNSCTRITDRNFNLCSGSDCVPQTTPTIGIAQTKDFDPCIPKDGIRFIFEYKGGKWLLSSIEAVCYVP